MQASVYATLSLLTISFLVLQKKKLSFFSHSIIFMIMAIIERNYLTTMNMELQIIRITEDHLLFVCFLLNREILVPVLILIFVERYIQSANGFSKAWVFLAGTAVLQAFTGLAVAFSLIGYVKWSYAYAVFENMAYLLIGLGVGKWAAIFERREKGDKHGDLRAVARHQ
jgi:hypothetical protein